MIRGHFSCIPWRSWRPWRFKQNNVTLPLAKVVVALESAPALRFARFDYIEFDGWADSMGKRNFAPSPRAAMALGDSRP